MVSGKLPTRKLLPYENTSPINIPPMKAPPPVKITFQNFFPKKIDPCKNCPPPGKITPNEIPSPVINHRNKRKNKITKFFALKKAVQ